jgi:hypothetical protein
MSQQKYADRHLFLSSCGGRGLRELELKLLDSIFRQLLGWWSRLRVEAGPMPCSRSSSSMLLGIGSADEDDSLAFAKARV